MSELKEYKNMYNGNKVLLFAPGPTLNDFSFDKYPELKNYKKCCVNGAILNNNLINIMDIWIWAGDLNLNNRTPSYDYIMNKLPEVNKETLKFVNCWTDNSITGINNTQTQIDPELAKSLGFVRYNQINKNVPINKFYKDLSTIESGPSAYTVAAHGVQILLYMGFTEIILIGFDCGGKHSYSVDEKYKNDICYWDSNNVHLELINWWKNMSKWIDNEYENVNIYVINPKGLKNIFKEYNKIDYFYIHTLSFYIGNNRDDNINKAFDKLDNTILSINQNKPNLLIVYVIYNELNNTIIEKYNKYKSLETDKTKVLILYRWNTGGTVQTLYYTYKYLINENINCNFIGVWEDDVIFKNNYFLDIVNEYLKNDYIFVGSLWPGSDPCVKYDNGVKIVIKNGIKRSQTNGCWLKKKHIYINEETNNTPINEFDYCHCEDPYITTIENLKKIENKLKKFTLCPENIKYNRTESGINYGEVGFPTRLKLNGFKFYGLSFSDNYVFLNTNSIID
tara:strand:+ start:28 stop:1551 length:1524 start_codon:yes stop_codon:yes gene_type:complete